MAINALLFLICCNVALSSVVHGYSVKSAKPSTSKARRTNNLPETSSVYINGIVYNVDPSTNWDRHPAEAFVIEDGIIVFVGSTEEAEWYIYDFSEVHDLHGAVALPGFHDVHMHPLEARSPVAGACQLPALTRPDSDAFTEELSVCPQYREGTEWVLGAGHSITPMLEYAREHKLNSPRKLLDRFIPNRPAAILEETSHSAWVNSKALEKAGITSKTPNRPGGIIMREPGSDEPNGILFENEAISIFDIAMDPLDNPDMYHSNYEGLLDALDELAAYGITSLCDARVLWRIRHDDAWKSACDESQLTARAVLGLWAYPEESDSAQIRILRSLHADMTDGCTLRKTQIKVYMDGIVESTTAAMEEPYQVNLSLPVVSEENIGLNYFDQARLEKYLRELQDFGDGHGFDFHIHAIGDRGIREALDAIEATQQYATSRAPRHRLTHLEIINPRDIPRFRNLDVIADFQVAGDFTLPSAHEELAHFTGMPKALFSIPVKAVIESGATATFSSDWDVSTVNPFVGLQHAVQRGLQSVSLKTAIEMYTANPAYAMRQEDRVGMLLEGMEADIVIIDQDILNIDEDDISNTQVLETIFMGERIYKRSDSGMQNRAYSMIWNLLKKISP